MKKLALILIGTMMSLQLFAADGSSGCGPGWYVFKENSLVSSALRATTNGILFPAVTLGMTFGTSNCSQHKIVKNEMKSLHFATHSFFELKSDMAKGQGEHLSAFASTIGCTASASKEAGQALQQNFSKIYPDANVNPERTLLEVYKVIFSNQSLTKQCAMNIG